MEREEEFNFYSKIKAFDRRNNRVVYVNESKWLELRSSLWFDRMDNNLYNGYIKYIKVK
jgi:hypothetical protein